MSRPLTFSGLMLSFVLLGCGKPAADKDYLVEGTVTLDGSPLKEGKIFFIVNDDGKPPQGGDISNGAFSIKARAGTKRVEIYAYKLVPSTMEGQTEPVPENYLSERYNSNSQLSAEVKAEGPNQLRFDLISP